MKAELLLPPDLVDAIANKVIDKLKPILTNNGKHDREDIIFNVHGLAEYLHVSHKWIYERTQFKEMPYLKIKGLLRFRKKDIDKWLSSHNVPTTTTPERILKDVK